MSDDCRPSVCVVGSGTTFVSGISYYTYYLAEAFAARTRTSVILMRRLIPRRLYPGRDRVGAPITTINPSDFAPTFDGVDWWGVPSVVRALRFLRTQQPDALILQWWSGSVLPWYLLLARSARSRGTAVILELHEDIDTAEARIPVIGPLLLRGLARLISWSSAYVVHSTWDESRMTASLALDRDRTFVVPLGPFPMPSQASSEPAARRDDDVRTILFFGTIRPYKGLEHLVTAFNSLPRDGGTVWKLLVVGESWEGWTLPLEAIADSPYRDDIEFINRYVNDDEVPGFFDRADVVALPYLRSSASGPLALTMSRGLPVVVTGVGGLNEAVAGYSGAFVVPPGDSESLATGLIEATAKVGVVHELSTTWADIVETYESLITTAIAWHRGVAPVLSEVVGSR